MFATQLTSTCRARFGRTHSVAQAGNLLGVIPRIVPRDEVGFEFSSSRRVRVVFPAYDGFRAWSGWSCLVEQGSRRVQVNAESRPIWYPGNEEVIPKYLDGTLAGDYGFDPLRLGSDPELLRWFVQAELIHSRLAMVGCVGVLVPDLLSHAGLIAAPEWFDAGRVFTEENNVSLSSLLITQLVLTSWVEAKRWADFKNPGSQGDGSFLAITDGLKGEGNGYPGGVHDPFGLGKSQYLPSLKAREIKNGRLAMVSMLGYWAQYAATGKGPIDNVIDHIADPGQVNFATNGVSVPF